MIRQSRDREARRDRAHGSAWCDPTDAAPQPVWRAVLRGHVARRHLAGRTVAPGQPVQIDVDHVRVPRP